MPTMHEKNRKSPINKPSRSLEAMLCIVRAISDDEGEDNNNNNNMSKTQAEKALSGYYVTIQDAKQYLEDPESHSLKFYKTKRGFRRRLQQVGGTYSRKAAKKDGLAFLLRHL
eukprot:m.10042 g.10042  ORF g.10042 m.10042 type:complete len:113 (+) comp9569_c0_seq1:43-381(+)